ncbi:MAG: adenosylhomocysteinase [Armatimonadetes bacterium]|nr:adenosylhomocysteinase [Armatimonadota bacterium]
MKSTLECKENYDVKNLNLAEEGELKIEWAEKQMPVLKVIQDRFSKEKPFKGIKISACLHVTAETANLMKTLKLGGAQVCLCASNPLSTQDDVAAALVKFHKIPVFAMKGEDNVSYYNHINMALEHSPQITLDDGADLVSTIHTKRKDLLENILGGTEETTTGVIRLRSMEKNQALKYPIIAVNDAKTKHLFDNRYGTGQSTIDGILRATNILLAGKSFVVVGYGWCGRGIAMRARGMGARVIVVEVDYLKALEAFMDGYEVYNIKEAAKLGDIFVTATGNINCIRKEHVKSMKDGVILCNSGHFNVEIDLAEIEKITAKKRKLREYVEEYLFSDGKKIYILGEGRLINLASAEGHPALVMDMSFANQALAVKYILDFHKQLENKVYKVTDSIDKEIAKLKLHTLGIEIDKLTKEQEDYLSSWEMGT